MGDPVKIGGLFDNTTDPAPEQGGDTEPAAVVLPFPRANPDATDEQESPEEAAPAPTASPPVARRSARDVLRPVWGRTKTAFGVAVVGDHALPERRPASVATVFRQLKVRVQASPSLLGKAGHVAYGTPVLLIYAVVESLLGVLWPPKRFAAALAIASVALLLVFVIPALTG
ncbi:hypothetical protein [Nonomuraea basaltis]|uniref:hypothetical protein n=1 Tax=Nonomuraea basaltis TaxID=2495887 RepID=UPI00110C5138|nr:hypothetical protein [Nonomuraea basaltis]TMR97510.1 hypothetical protein EJK15_17465 [Nonomuraea basaltis]